MRIDLPSDYIAYLEREGLAEGFTEGPPGYFALWRPDEIEASNRELQVETYAPGFLGFGTDGGGELLAFDESGAVFMLPMIGMEPQYANRIADSWREVAQRIDRHV
ncbi:MAG: SMI1/KNR4 family protein [Pseudomonadota bacterium]|nr:SMI1/KNR4 family protein [Pseudomonadota bacterium]